MASVSEEKKICSRVGLKPLTGHNILFYYAPLQGVLSYTALSINVMNPSLILRIFPKRDITNVLLVNTLLGSGLYLYSRPHMQAITSKRQRILFSWFGSITFSLGSVLIWAILRSVVPQNVAVCTALGVGSGVALLKIGCAYTEHVDSLVNQ